MSNKSFVDDLPIKNHRDFAMLNYQLKAQFLTVSEDWSEVRIWRAPKRINSPPKNLSQWRIPCHRDKATSGKKAPEDLGVCENGLNKRQFQKWNSANDLPWMNHD